MALSRKRRYEPVNYWPGFVDALSTMLLVIIFLLSVFMLAQFFLSREVTGKDEALVRLNRQIEELTNLLALERTQKSDDERRSQASPRRSIRPSATRSAKEAAAAPRRRSRRRTGGGGLALDAEKEISAQALAQVDVLNQQIAALRKQLAAIEDALPHRKRPTRNRSRRSSSLATGVLNLPVAGQSAPAQEVERIRRSLEAYLGANTEIVVP